MLPLLWPRLLLGCGRPRYACPSPTRHCRPNTGDKLRGARSTRSDVDDNRTAERADDDAAPHFQWPLVCFIPLFDAARLHDTMTAPTALDDSQIVLLIPSPASPTRPSRAWHGAASGSQGRQGCDAL